MNTVPDVAGRDVLSQLQGVPVPQFKRVGHDFTADMENPNPDFWEPVDGDPEPEPTEADESAESEGSES